MAVALKQLRNLVAKAIREQRPPNSKGVPDDNEDDAVVTIAELRQIITTLHDEQQIIHDIAKLGKEVTNCCFCATIYAITDESLKLPKV